MKKSLAFLFIASIGLCAFYMGPTFKTPIWPAKIYDESKNTLTSEKIALGRFLFYDPILSENNTISCASCHLSYTGFAHTDHALSHGIYDRVGTRNAPPLFNLAYRSNFMWDGAIHSLDAQPMAPIENHLEMNETLGSVVFKLQQKKFYREQFFRAWGDSSVTGEHVLKALSAFLVSIESKNSKYDRVISGLEQFNEQEEKGYALFRTHCNACHQEPLFTNNSYKSNGLSYDELLHDAGRMRITHRPADSMLFMVPSLRNIEVTYPYMHDGRFTTLQQVVNHYDQLASNKPGYLSKELNHSSKLSSNDKQDLIAFLLTLTDHEFLFNPVYQFPKGFEKEISR